MIAAAGYNDVMRIYNITQRDGIDYNLAYIGSDFNEVLPSAVRSRLHARPVRLRLPAGAPRLRLGEEAADHLIRIALRGASARPTFSGRNETALDN